jgi:hypothetical protein
VWSKIFPFATQLKATRPARHTALEAGSFGKLLQHAEINFLKPRLQRTSQIAVPIL